MVVVADDDELLKKEKEENEKREGKKKQSNESYNLSFGARRVDEKNRHSAIRQSRAKERTRRKSKHIRPVVSRWLFFRRKEEEEEEQTGC